MGLASAAVRAAALAAACLASSGLGPPPMVASTVAAKSLHALCGEAADIFVATVEQVAVRWADGARSRIETQVTFGDLEILAGPARASRTLRFAGGELDGLRDEVAGMPQFAPGERVVVFARTEQSLSPIVGFHQGVFRIADSARGSVVLSAHRLPVLGVAGGTVQLGGATTPPDAALSLADFLDLVRRDLAAGGGTP
jgi:hypothetical protein